MSVLTKSGSAVLRTSSRETLRQTQAEDLRQRLYNAKSRTIGIDKDALDRQVEELKARRAAEAAEEKAYARSFSEVLATVGDMEADEYSRKVQEAAELRAFWRAQQDRTARKEFDLSDPEALRKTAIPVGLDGSGPASGPSSMQLFPSDFGPTAEDVRRRNAAIAAENAEILRQKKAAEAAARATEARELEAYQDAMMTFTVRDWDDTTAGVDAARRLRDENKRLAMERKSRERAEKAASIAAEAAQVAALSSSSLLTEDRSQTYGRGGYGKVRVDHFKGFSQQEVDAIRAEQERQRLELEARRAAEKAESLAEADIWSQATAAAYEMERQQREAEAEATRKYYLDVKTQQRDAKIRASSGV